MKYNLTEKSVQSSQVELSMVLSAGQQWAGVVKFNGCVADTEEVIGRNGRSIVGWSRFFLMYGRGGRG